MLCNKPGSGSDWCIEHSGVRWLSKAASYPAHTGIDISGAMDQIPNFQEFLNQTKFEREMEGQEMYGIIIAALAENYFPV